MKWKRTIHRKGDVQWVRRFALFPTLLYDHYNSYGDNNYYVWFEFYWEKQTLNGRYWDIYAKTQNRPTNITS